MEGGSKSLEQRAGHIPSTNRTPNGRNGILACLYFSTLYGLGSPALGMAPPTAKMGLSPSTNGIKIIP